VLRPAAEQQLLAGQAIMLLRGLHLGKHFPSTEACIAADWALV
jgi:hypothetical protein